MKPVLEILRELKPRTRFDKFSLSVVFLFALWRLLQSAFSVQGYLFWNLFLNFALVIVVVRYAFKGIRWAFRKLLWRLRRRLIITYVLIGVVPVLLLFSIMLILGYFSFGQLASYFVFEEVEHLTSNLQTANQSLMGPMLDSLATPAGDSVEVWRKQFAPVLDGLGSKFSRLWIDAQNGNHHVAWEFENGRLGIRSGSTRKPDWIRENVAGLFNNKSEVFIGTFQAREKFGSREWLLLRAPLDASVFRTISFQNQVSIREVDLIPVDSNSPRGVPRLSINGKSYIQRVHSETPSSHTSKLTWYDYPIHFPLFLKPPRDWVTGKESTDIQPMYLMMESTWLRLAKRLFSVGLIGEENVFVYLLISVSIFFLVIEFVALISSVLLTRTITGAVYNLDEGAKHIMRGNFSHRIRVKRRDQLSSLGETFNSMTTSIERLLKEQVEKQRLESELTIALEVQRQLFPREAPTFRKLQIAGMCNPARIVSGDYYDYLLIAPTTVGLALGDVSGKGVSAALLMASLQAALRSHSGMVHDLLPNGTVDSSGGDGRSSSSQVARVVGLLNQQLFQNSPSEKYVTFFYGVYDEHNAEFTYTNAGHLPPLVCSPNGVRRLETGGTVLGLFPTAQYEQGSIRLSAGDVIVAYTDGITEAENTFGEQFGEGRLIRVVQGSLAKSPDGIVEDILLAVSEWVETGEPQDDMTLIVAKAV